MVQLSGILLRFLLVLDDSEDICRDGGEFELVLVPGVVTVCMLGLLDTEEWVMDAIEGADEL